MTPRALVDAAGTRRRLRALTAAGWSLADLAEILGCSRQNVSTLRNANRRVTADSARQVADLYGWLTNCSAPTGRRAYRTSFTAARAGWNPPVAWEGVDIDDPGAQPNTAVPITLASAEDAA